MSEYPRSIEQAMMEYQVELENWVVTAPIEHIKEFFVAMHSGVYPDDWEDIIDKHTNNQENSCTKVGCAELILAIRTMDSERKELLALFS